MRFYKLNKTVLQFQNNAAEFLNGLTSNSLDKPRNALTDIHGKIIAAFDQIKVSDEEVWIVVGTPFVDAVLSHLDRYMRLSGVKFQKFNSNVYFDLDGDYPLKDGETVIPQKKGNIIISPNAITSSITDEEFTIFRLEHNIPIHGIDFQDEFLLNIGEDEFVSFTKGCFLGQEPISKVHNRSKPTWKLVVKYDDACSPEEKSKLTSSAVDPTTKRVRGFVFIKNA